MAEDNGLNVCVIIGSTRQDRFCPTPARWIANEARRRGDLDVDVVDLAETDLPYVLMGDDENAPRPAAVETLAPRIDRADAFIVVTPVYNRGYPASLKNAIDWFFDEWSAKPVGFVSYGGISGGLSSVEQLRSVFNEVHATTIRNTISFADYPDKFDDDGTPTQTQVASDAAKDFLDQLTWWGTALKEAKAKRPYQG